MTIETRTCPNCDTNLTGDFEHFDQTCPWCGQHHTDEFLTKEDKDEDSSS